MSTMFLEAVKATGGNTQYAKIIETLDGMKNFKMPFGMLNMKDRVGILDEYIFKAVKIGDKVRWKPIKKYPNVKPR